MTVVSTNCNRQQLISIFYGTLQKKKPWRGLGKIEYRYHLTTKKRGDYSRRRRVGEMLSRQSVQVLLRKDNQSNIKVCKDWTGTKSRKEKGMHIVHSYWSLPQVYRNKARSLPKSNKNGKNTSMSIQSLITYILIFSYKVSAYTASSIRWPDS